MPWRQGDGPEPQTITYPYGREPAVWVWTSSDRHPDPAWYRAKVVAKHLHPDGRIVLGCEVRFGWHSATQFRSYLWGEDSVLAASRTAHGSTRTSPSPRTTRRDSRPP